MNRNWPLPMILLTIALAGPAHAATAQNTPGACGADTLCLAGGRFRITADWQTATGPGSGHPVLLTANTGYFWFFDSANVEMLVKVLDACRDYDREWVFAGGLTDVGVTMTVTDTRMGISKTYVNPPGTAFLPIQDTSTFISDCLPEPPAPSPTPPPPVPTPTPTPPPTSRPPQTPHPAPTRTPPPPLPQTVAGSWTETYDAGWNSECSPVPVRASFTQQGSTVDGIVTLDGCGFTNATIHGTFFGNHLHGTVTGAHFGSGAEADGAFVDPSTLLLDLGPWWMTFHLRRDD